MKKKQVLCAMAVMGMTVLSAPFVSAQEMQVIPVAEVSQEEAQPRTDIKEWRFKVIDGHLYKRLYNRSTGRWETDWILIE